MSDPTTYRIMGIDPGTNYMGYGVLDVCGREVRSVVLGDIDLHKLPDPYAKLRYIFERVGALVDEYAPREVALESPFFVIATQNPVEMQGTFPLPEAQLDRFLLCLSLGYPDKEQELALLSRTAVPEEGKPVVTTAQLLNARKELAQVKVSAAVQEYLVELAHATRTHHQIQLGLSTRGMLSLLEVSKAVAAIRGRNYVTPDDIKHIAADCMAHRMAARGAMWEENHETCRRIVLELLETVPVPKESQWN